MSTICYVHGEIILRSEINPRLPDPRSGPGCFARARGRFSRIFPPSANQKYRSLCRRGWWEGGGLATWQDDTSHGRRGNCHRRVSRPPRSYVRMSMYFVRPLSYVLRTVRGYLLFDADLHGDCHIHPAVISSAFSRYKLGGN